MSKAPGWTVNVESLSPEEIVRLLKQLAGGSQRSLIDSLRQQLIKQAREEGASNDEIIRTLSWSVARGLKLHEIAKEWAPLFGITVQEFKRIANAK
jgi:hypothetical protein